jgi:peroxiredoxin
MVVRWQQIAVVILLLVVAGSVAACGGNESTVDQGVEVGKEARDFTLKTLDGEEVSLSEYRGQVVLLNFWATWCPPCRAEVPEFEEAYRQRAGDGFVVLGVSVQDPPHLVDSFIEEFQMTYPVVLDEKGVVSKEYRTPGLPMSLVIDQEGIIQERHLGYLSADVLDRYLGKVLDE